MWCMTFDGNDKNKWPPRSSSRLCQSHVCRLKEQVRTRLIRKITIIFEVHTRALLVLHAAVATINAVLFEIVQPEVMIYGVAAHMGLNQLMLSHFYHLK